MLEIIISGPQFFKILRFEVGIGALRADGRCVRVEIFASDAARGQDIEGRCFYERRLRSPFSLWPIHDRYHGG